jgi:ribosomal protein S18 acetylase RimI-like enzyme
MTIQIREFSADHHLPDIITLLNEEYKNLPEFIPFTEERLPFQIRRRDLKVLIAEDNARVLGVIGTRLEERSEVNVFWLTAESHNREEIENLLVDEIERTAKSDTISVGLDERSPRIKDWIRRGYVLEPGFQRMFAKLDGAKPVPKVEKGSELRTLMPEEEEKLVSVVNAGFGWQRLKRGILETWKSEDPPFREDWVQVASISETFVSAVVARPDTEYNRFQHLTRGYLGPAATVPEFRNKHLASALTARAMNFLFEKGFDTVRLGTSERNVSSIALLKSLGFEVGSVTKILRKKLTKT